jgi:hypothetical protein
VKGCQYTVLHDGRGDLLAEEVMQHLMRGWAQVGQLRARSEIGEMETWVFMRKPTKEVKA